MHTSAAHSSRKEMPGNVCNEEDVHQDIHHLVTTYRTRFSQPRP